MNVKVDTGEVVVCDVRRTSMSGWRSETLNARHSPRVGVRARMISRYPRMRRPYAVFPSVTGAQLWATSFKWAWTPVRAAFGRPTMALHELRHFCATYLLELGLAPADVAVQLGHPDGGALVMST